MNYEAQYLGYWCGPASIQAALAALHIKLSQETIAASIHVTKKDGTPEEEIQRGLIAGGAHNIDAWSSRVRHLSVTWLRNHLAKRGPVILCVEHWGHWVAAIGLVGRDTVQVWDPGAGRGLMTYSTTDLADTWRLGNHKGGPRYYGVGASV